MKVVIIVLSFFNIILAQEKMAIELVTQSVNFHNTTVKFSMNAIGQVWDGFGHTFWLSSLYQSADEIIEYPGNHISCIKGFNQC
jgi:hypothetical protein